VSPQLVWNLDPALVLVLVLYVGVYAWRWRRARAEAGPRGAPVWRLVSFGAGVLMLAIALVSPVERLAEQLFVMHMVQHILMLDFAAILIILGFTKVILRPVTRRVQRIEQAAGPIAHPAFAVVFYAGTLWMWHVPAMYQLALEHPGTWHVVEHLQFTAAGLLFWWHLLSPIRSRHRLAGLGPIAYLASTKLLVGILGIVITFSPEVLYPYYAEQPRLWGLTALEDQAVAGLIMAFEESVVMVIALFWLFARMLAESEQEEQRAERYGTL
jgi:putative membrane protein